MKKPDGDSKVANAIVDTIGVAHGDAATKSDIERLEASIAHLETSTKAEIGRLEMAVKLSEARVTNKLWWAIGLIVAILKVLDYLLPALGG